MNKWKIINMSGSNTHTRQYLCLEFSWTLPHASLSSKLKTKARALSHILWRKWAKEDLLEIQQSC